MSIPFLKGKKMDVIKLLEQLELLTEEISKIIAIMEDNLKLGLNEMPHLMEKIQEVLPNWFYFIKETEIGSEQMILNVLEDTMEAVQAADQVLLVDVLLFGLQNLAVEYGEIIKGALYDE